MIKRKNIGIRWTIGDVSNRGFEALKLSIWGAYLLFKDSAKYMVCVNTLGLDIARHKTGVIPDCVAWRHVERELPDFLARRIDNNMAQGVGWKFAPLRCFPDCHELSLDNDCILWEIPKAVLAWLASDNPQTCVMAEDVVQAFGVFENMCEPFPRNSGIRGIPPAFNLETALHEVLSRKETETGAPLLLTSELDEQGLQTVALSLHSPLLAVSLEDVSVCSPFWPHRPYPGKCGVHFVGLNARHIPWDYYGIPADQWMTRHWNHYRNDLYARVRAPLNAPLETSA